MDDQTSTAAFTALDLTGFRQPPPNVVFRLHDKECIRVEPGKFFVDGVQVDDHQNVYEAFVRFLSGVGALTADSTTGRLYTREQVLAFMERAVTSDADVEDLETILDTKETP